MCGYVTVCVIVYGYVYMGYGYVILCLNVYVYVYRSGSAAVH